MLERAIFIPKEFLVSTGGYFLIFFTIFLRYFVDNWRRVLCDLTIIR